MQQELHLGVIEPGGHGQVAGVAAAAIAQRAGAGPSPLLMHADGEDPRIASEGILDAIAVMRIDIHVGDTVQTLIQPGEDAEDRIVQVAEAGGAIGAAMMGAAAGAVDGAARLRQMCGEKHAAGRCHWPAENLRIDGVALRADPVAGAILIADRLGLLRAPQRRHVSGMVEAADPLFGGHGRRAKHVVWQPAHGAA